VVITETGDIQASMTSMTGKQGHPSAAEDLVLIS
jgi:hypothetical protein